MYKRQDLYFPNGRPADLSAPQFPDPTVVAYADANFGGTSWELTEGTYTNVDLDAGPIGDDAISSFEIPEGYEVNVYQWPDGTGRTATYTGSMPALGFLNNDISRIEVRYQIENFDTIGESYTIAVDDEWKTVTLSQSYNDPVVIAGTPTYEGTDPATVRIRNVTANSFEIRISEWNYLNPQHSRELVSYMVVEAGEYTLPDGSAVVAGNRSGQGDDWQTYSLGSAFDGLGTPVVLANVVTENEFATVATRVVVNSSSEFEVRLQEQESADGAHVGETVSYFAIEAGASVTGVHHDAGTFSADQSGGHVDFHPGVDFSSYTSFFAEMQTFNGSDTAALRRTVLNAVGADVFTEEEQSADNEITHAAEIIGFFALEPGLIAGTPGIGLGLLPGDFNGNGIVDAADFTVWQDNVGTDHPLFGNGDETGSSLGVVDIADYILFFRSFGNTIPGPPPTQTPFVPFKTGYVASIAPASEVLDGPESGENARIEEAYADWGLQNPVQFSPVATFGETRDGERKKRRTEKRAVAIEGLTSEALKDELDTPSRFSRQNGFGAP